MRRLAAAIGLVACMSGASAVAAGEPQVRFPRDHFGHPASSIEWWYFTALVRDRSGTPYSVFFTLFSGKGALVPVAEVRNLTTGEAVGHSERIVSGRVGTRSLDVIAGGARLRYVGSTNTWELSIAEPGLRLSLNQRPEKPYALHGDGTGLVRQSVAGPSHYYSATRMRATGALHRGRKSVALTGESWFDHQWGDFLGDPRAFDWDWFSCRFDDRTELMLYRFRDRRTGRPLPDLSSGTFVQPGGRTVAVRRFQAQAGRRTLRAAGRVWPLDWRLRVPGLHLTESVHSLLRDQLVRTSILPTFWEGAARAAGTRAGTCFVEISDR